MAGGKHLGMLLLSTLYGYEIMDTAVKIAETALSTGHQVNILACGDGVHGFTAGQKPLAGLEDRRFQVGSSW